MLYIVRVCTPILPNASGVLVEPIRGRALRARETWNKIFVVKHFAPGEIKLMKIHRAHVRPANSSLNMFIVQIFTSLWGCVMLVFVYLKNGDLFLRS